MIINEIYESPLVEMIEILSTNIVMQASAGILPDVEELDGGEF